jgi:hypothetical protein
MKKILAILFLFLLFLSLIISVYLVRSRVNFMPRATEPGQLSLENSYLFASPLVARAGDQEKITVSIFILSDQGLGIVGKQVSLYSAPQLSATTVRGETDSRGLALFEVTSSVPGQFNLWATVPEGRVQQTVTVTFNP